MEAEVVKALIQEGILGAVAVAEGIAIVYLFRELRQSWKERSDVSEKRVEEYYRLCSEIHASLKTLIEKVENDK